MDGDGISYREDFGLWWPDYDRKPVSCHGKVMAQVGAVDCTIRLCKARNVVVQAGGHCGVWPKRLSEHFGTVYTFEPDPVCFAAMKKNLEGISNIKMSRCALGPKNDDVMLMPHPSAGGAYISPAGRIPTVQWTIDSLKLDACDAIVLDIEGYEAEALKGARETIERFRPILHLEILPRSRQAIEAMVSDLGYKFHIRIHADEIFLP